MLETSGVTRAICMEESVKDEAKLRIQYGVPNKFYPEPIRVYDLLLDIDAYTEVALPVAAWEETVTKLNHRATETFLGLIRPSFLESLRQ